MDQQATPNSAHSNPDSNGAPPQPHAHHNVDPSAAMAQRMIAPAVSMGLTWAARKAMNAAYEKRTGTQPPIASDNNVPLGKVIAWAALTAVVTTVIDTVVNRVVSRQLPEHNA